MPKIIAFPGIAPEGQETSGRIHTCNVCGKTGPWDDSWGWKWVLHNSGTGPGWEEVWKTCSDKCREKG